MSKVCATCGQQASFTLFHRDGFESYTCGDCPHPRGVHSIAKIGLESKSDYKFNIVESHEKRDFTQDGEK